MSDIVERLRAVSPDDYDECSAVMNEAATAIEGLCENMAYAARLLSKQTDKIERLRAALRPLACTCKARHQDACSRSEVDCPFWNARAALEERT